MKRRFFFGGRLFCYVGVEYRMNGFCVCVGWGFMESFFFFIRFRGERDFLDFSV